MEDLSMAKEIMTVEQLATYLQLNPHTIYRKAQAGEIPAIRIGKVLRFKKNIIDAWLRLSSLSWSQKDRKKMRRRGEQFAKSENLSESDVLKAIKKYRSKG